MIPLFILLAFTPSILATHRVYLGPALKSSTPQSFLSRAESPECSEYTSTVISGQNTALCSLKGDYDGHLLLATSSVTIDVYNKSQSKVHSYLLPHEGNVTAIVQLNSSNIIVTASLDSTAITVDFLSGNILYQFTNHTGPLRCLRYLRSLNLIVSGGDDQILYFWNPYTGEIKYNISIGSRISSIQRFRRDDLNMLAVGTDSGIIYLKVSNEDLLQFYGKHATPHPVYSMAHIFGTQFIASLEADGVVRFYDVLNPEKYEQSALKNSSSSFNESDSYGELVYIESKHVLFYAKKASKLYSWKINEKMAPGSSLKVIEIELVPFQNYAIPRQDVSLGRAVYDPKSFEFFLLLKNGFYKYNFKNFETVNFYGECYRECPRGFFPDEFKNCKKCSRDCTTCSLRADNCLICANSLYQLDGKCLNDCPLNSELISVKDKTCKCLADHLPDKQGACVEVDDYPAERENFLAWMVGSVIVGFLSLSMCLYCVFMFYEQKKHPLPAYKIEEESSHGSIAQESDRENDAEQRGKSGGKSEMKGEQKANIESSKVSLEQPKYERHNTLYRSPEKFEQPTHEEWCFPARGSSIKKQSPE